jgi:ATP-dependent Clp protease ATP-binding subunit ClpA
MGADMFERFTDRARRVVVLAQEEARLLRHNYIGTEHLLLGLIREGEGVAAQVLVEMGADLARARQQVLALLQQGDQGDQGDQPAAPAATVARPQTRPVLLGLSGRVHALESRLSAIEQRVGTGPSVHPDLASLAGQVQQLSSELERLRVLLRQHGIEPEDTTA